MVWFVACCIILLSLMIFISTLSIKPGSLAPEKDSWVKVKLRVNSDLQASWCRVMPGKGVKFYTLDGHLINHSRDRVQVVEPCLESNIKNPIPDDELPKLVTGTLSDAWPRWRNPFSRRS